MKAFAAISQFTQKFYATKHQCLWEDQESPDI